MFQSKITQLSVNGKISELSESCSIIDENESVQVEQIESTSSSGSKNSDKENSNIRNNKPSTNRSVSSH
jgi:hypothetical protein